MKIQNKRDFIMMAWFLCEWERKAIIYDVQSEPVYDEETGKLKGWKVSYWGVERKSFPVRIQFKQFFKETWFRNSYRAASRFQNKLLAKQNENTK